MGATTYNRKCAATSGAPIPFAHIQIAGSLRGTTSGEDGSFQLTIYSTDNTLLVSALGFVKSSVPIIRSKINYEIVLPVETLLLNPVVVYPVDEEQRLIKNAVRSIAANYPTQSELIDGVVKETFSRDSLGQNFFHRASSEIQVLKKDYSNRERFGQVRYVRTLQVEEQSTPPDIRVYAGAHLAHRFDFVLRRDGPLDTTKLKNYNLLLADTLLFEGKNLFKVSYTNRDSSQYGNLFILDTTWAIVKIEDHLDFENRNSFERSLSSSGRVYLNIMVEYFQSDSKWRLAYVNYKTKFDKKEQFYLNSTFASSNYVAAPDEIPYYERLHFGQYMLDESKVRMKTDSVQVRISPQSQSPSRNNVKRSSIQNFLQKVEFETNLFIAPYACLAHTISINNNSLSYTRDVEGETSLLVATSLSMNYRFDSQTRIHLSTAGGLANSRYREVGLGISQLIRLSPTSRFSLMPRLTWHWINHTNYIGSTESLENFQINNIKFDSDVVKLYSGTRYSAVSLAVELSYELAYRWLLKVGGSWSHTTYYQNGLVIQEDASWFTSQYAFLPHGKRGLSITAQDRIMDRTWVTSIGFIFRLQ